MDAPQDDQPDPLQGDMGIGPSRDWNWLRQPALIRADRPGTSVSLEVIVTQGQGTSQGVCYQ